MQWTSFCEITMAELYFTTLFEASLKNLVTCAQKISVVFYTGFKFEKKTPQMFFKKLRITQPTITLSKITETRWALSKLNHETFVCAPIMNQFCRGQKGQKQIKIYSSWKNYKISLLHKFQFLKFSSTSRLKNATNQEKSSLECPLLIVDFIINERQIQTLNFTIHLCDNLEFLRSKILANERRPANSKHRQLKIAPTFKPYVCTLNLKWKRKQIKYFINN